MALCTLPRVAFSDGFHPRADVLDGTPPSASADGKPACAVARQYVERINAGRYDEVSSLFAPDAVFLTPTGAVLTGREQIGQFYKSLLGQLRPAVVPISFIADGRECVMELAAVTQHDAPRQYRLAAIDHFTVGADGLVAHMIVYLRPATAVQPTR
jgi:hypothetical protein